MLGPFASYALEKKLAKDPCRFGKGAIEGVAGPEAANNAGAQTSFIPLLTLGIPPNAVMALMVGAMTIHGIVPGPLVMVRNPSLFWGLIATHVDREPDAAGDQPPADRDVGPPVEGALPAPVPDDPDLLLHRHLLGEQLPRDVVFTAGFAVLGYAASKLGFESAPLLLGYVLGRLLEENLRRALAISRGSFWSSSSAR